MTRDKLDTLWSSAVHAALNAGEDYARYHFAALLRDHLISEGWRQCAKEQRTTQFCAVVERAKQEEREACAKVCEAHISVYLKDGERWLKGKKGQPDTRMKDLAPHMEAAWEAEQLLKNKSGVEWITQAHKFAAAIRARGNE